MIIKNEQNPLFIKISNVFLIVASIWLLFTIAAVYILYDGGKSHRIETASYVFVAAIAVKLVLQRKTSDKEQGFGVKWNPQLPTKILLFSITLLLWILLYLPYLNLPFLSDDYVFIVKYMDSPFVFDDTGFFRPVFASIFFVLLKTFGTDPLPFHLLNLLLHAGSSFLVYRISKKLLGSFSPAFAVGIIFFMNPVQAEAVHWISGMQETLWAFFFLIALTLHLQKPDLSGRSIFFTSLFVFLSLLSKETAVCFLPIFILLDLFTFKFNRGNKLKYAYIAYCLTLSFYILLRSNFSSIPAGHLTNIDLLSIKQFISQPFKVFLYPWNQAFAGEQIMLKFIISSLFVIITSLFFLQKRTHFNQILSALAFIYIPLLPLTGMFFVASDLQGSRYLYLPILGWGLLLSVILFRLISKNMLAVVINIFVLIGFTLCLKLNLEPWGMAGKTIKSLPADLKGKNAYDSVYGAYILRNGMSEYMQLKNKHVIGNDK